MKAKEDLFPEGREKKMSGADGLSLADSPRPFLHIENATVSHLGQVVFHHLNFTMSKGQNWAILSVSGAEKTAFLDTLIGKSLLKEGRISRDFAVQYQELKTREGQINSYKDLIAVVSQRYEFKNKSNRQDFYYQQRFNSSESEEAATVEEYLNEKTGQFSGFWDVYKVVNLLDLTSLKNKSLIKLSNGETRRLAIAGALIRNPRLLLMDQPMTGLDVATRAAFGNILQFITESGIQVVITTTAEEIPNAITHIGVIEQGRMEVVMEKRHFNYLNFNHGAGSFKPNVKLIRLLEDYPLLKFKKLILMKDIHIRYGEKLVLEGINWEMKQGECWSLRGHNGAGKSTLLSLILGENPQVYANEVTLFDRKRGSGESIWDVKKPTGFVSPEISRYFPKHQNGLQVVLSGLFDTMGVFRKTNPVQEKLAYEWMEALNLGKLSTLRLDQMSMENQRFCILARAMVKSPALLVLDEAAQGLDDYQRIRFRETIDLIIRRTGISLLYVSHYTEDIPSCVNRHIELKEGRVFDII